MLLTELLGYKKPMKARELEKNYRLYK